MPSSDKAFVPWAKLCYRSTAGYDTRQKDRLRLRGNSNLTDLQMVPGARIELATPAFSGRRSTSELPRHA